MLSNISPYNSPQKTKAQSFGSLLKMTNFDPSSIKQTRVVNDLVNLIHSEKYNALFCILDKDAYIACERGADNLLLYCLKELSENGLVCKEKTIDIFNAPAHKQSQFNKIQPLLGVIGDVNKARNEKLFKLLRDAFPQ